mgnify:CR=1 FL=1|jgi:Glycosyltransferases involved in cell wall biogenesis
MAPRVSVIIPVRNVAPYVGESVGSILAQSFGDFELIVVDDCSTDETGDILRGMTDPRLRVVRNPAQMGAFATFNVALEMAGGEIIACMEGDDIALPDRLAMQVRLMDSRPEVTVCGSDLEMFGAQTGLSDAPQHDGDIKAMFLDAARNIFNPTAVVRHDFLRRNRVRWNPAWMICGDYAFWVDCMRHGAVFANVKAPLLRYRRHAEALSNKLDIKRTELFRVRRRLVADFFPHLTQRESDALADLLTGRPVATASFTFAGVCEAVAAAVKAKAWTEPSFGENRDVVNQILDIHILRFQRALLGQNG